MNATTIASLPFKPPFVPKLGWVNYGLALGLFLVMLLVLVKKIKPVTPLQTKCRLIEKKHLNHKTVIYILEYQQQQLLLADNQQALTIHALTPQATHDAA